jgi:hypothetical protein
MVIQIIFLMIRAVCLSRLSIVLSAQYGETLYITRIILLEDILTYSSYLLSVLMLLLYS